MCLLCIGADEVSTAEGGVGADGDPGMDGRDGG